MTDEESMAARLGFDPRRRPPSDLRRLIDLMVRLESRVPRDAFSQVLFETAKWIGDGCPSRDEDVVAALLGKRDQRRPSPQEQLEGRLKSIWDNAPAA